MTIAEVARRAGLPAKTIRYYEAIGLIRPLRQPNGYRAFRDSDVMKLAFLARARSLGFSIDDCRALLALWEDKGRASADVKRLALGHLGRIEAKIAELEGLRGTLAALVEACAGDARPDCPILAGLALPLAAGGTVAPADGPRGARAARPRRAPPPSDSICHPRERLSTFPDGACGGILSSLSHLAPPRGARLKRNPDDPS